METSISKKRPLMITAYLCLVFTIPFSLGDLGSMLFYSIALLVVFPFYALFSTKSLPFSLRQELKQYYPALYYLLLLFAVSSLISWASVLFAENSLQQKIMASLRYLEYVLLAFYCFVLARLYRAERVSVVNFFMMIVYGALVSIALFAYIYFVDGAPNVRRWAGDPPLGTNLRMTGILLSAAIMTCVVRIYIEPHSRFFLCFLYFALFALSAFLIWTASRINILATVFSVAIVAYLMRAWLKTSWLKLMSVFLVMLLSVPVGDYFSISPWGGLNRMVGFADRSLEQETLEAAVEEFGSGRIQVWGAAISAGMEKPVFGQGPYGFYFSDYIPEEIEMVHNVFLHFFVEFGFVGASLFILALFTLAFYGAKYAKQAFINKDVNWLVAASVVLVLTMSSVANRAYEFILSTYILASAFAAFPMQRKKKAHSTESEVG